MERKIHEALERYQNRFYSLTMYEIVLVGVSTIDWAIYLNTLMLWKVGMLMLVSWNNGQLWVHLPGKTLWFVKLFLSFGVWPCWAEKSPKVLEISDREGIFIFLNYWDGSIQRETLGDLAWIETSKLLYSSLCSVYKLYINNPRFSVSCEETSYN